MSEENPKIYVADLAAYNNAILHGVWLDATAEVEVLQTAIQAMLAESPIPEAEEWAIHDYEGFYDYRLNEFASLKNTQAVAQLIAEYGKLAAAVLNHFGDIAEARRSLAELYVGSYEKLTDFARELMDERDDIPDSIRIFIDYEALANDMLDSGEIFTLGTDLDEVHIFNAY